MDHVKLTENKLDVQEITELVAHESCGAVSLFVGTTRDNFEGKTVVKLEYESYESMAKKEMLGICSRIRDKWPDVKNIAIFHRLGLVPVKEASVVIAISSPHRRESLDAVSFTIEQLKKSVPIFKKEIYRDPVDRVKSSGPPKKKLKSINFDFKDCKIVDHVRVSKDLVQINVDEDEIGRRIKNFIERKREEIDKSNIKDFIDAKDDGDDGCARVNSVIFRVKDSKGHLKVRRVKNEYGPQDDLNYKNTLSNLMVKSEQFPAAAPNNIEIESINERLENAERFLNLTESSKKGIFERMKSIEDRILFLESVSPEYSHFVEKANAKLKATGSNPVETKKSSYTSQSLDSIIKELEMKRQTS